MQISNNVAVIGKNQGLGIKDTPNKIQYQKAFGSDYVHKTEQNQGDKKSGVDFKTLTNVLGVAAWLFVVGYSVKDLKLLEKKSPESILRGIKATKTKANSYLENIASKGSESVDKALEGKKGQGAVKFFYNLGDKFQNAKMKLGGELFNNLLYAFGTLVVMPAVVLFSPLGKKDASKEDKFFTVLRQPISVAATLGMQFTFDKLIDKYVPAVLKGNKLEDKSILDSEGAIKLTDKKGKFIEKNYEKIRYNADSAKDGFKHAVDGLLTKDEIKSMFHLLSFEEGTADTYKGKLKDVLNDKYKKQGLNLKNMDDIYKNDIDKAKGSFSKFKADNPAIADNVEKVFAKFKKMSAVLDNNKMAVQKSKTMVNVLAASAIGCTFLNVVYGKTMKAIKNQQIENNMLAQNNKEKEVK